MMTTPLLKLGRRRKKNTSIPLSSPIVVTVLLKYFKRVFFQDTNQRNTTKMKTPTCIQKHDVRMTLTTTHAQTGLATGAAFFHSFFVASSSGRVPLSSEMGLRWMSTAPKALSSARKVMQNTWNLISIQSIPSMILAKLSGSRAGSGRSTS